MKSEICKPWAVRLRSSIFLVPEPFSRTRRRSHVKSFMVWGWSIIKLWDAAQTAI